MRNTFPLMNFSFLLFLSVSAVQFKAISGMNKYYLSDGRLPLSSNQSRGISCPTWFTYNNTSKQCICGDDLGGVINCDNEEQKVYIMRCYCMTYDNQTGVTVGSCFTNCLLKKSNMTFQWYLRVPMNHSNLNEIMCGEHWN